MARWLPLRQQAQTACMQRQRNAAASVTPALYAELQLAKADVKSRTTLSPKFDRFNQWAIWFDRTHCNKSMEQGHGSILLQAL